MPKLYPNPVIFDVVGVKILGVKTHNISIFDAWRDKGILLKQPLAKFQPPKNIEDIVRFGIAQSLQKKEDIVNKTVKQVQQSESMNNILSKVENLKHEVHPAYEAIKSLKVSPVGTISIPPPPQIQVPSVSSGGAMFGWGDIANAIGGIGQSIWNGLQNIGNAAQKGFEGVSKIWDALVNLADFMNDMYNFIKDWKSHMDDWTKQTTNMQAKVQGLAEAANQLIVDSRKFQAQLIEAMDKSLAKYFDDLTFHLLKYGQVDVPTAVVGSITVSVKNNTPFPMTITIPDLTIRSGPYTLHKGAYVVNTMPFESDVGGIPFEMHGLEESRYVVNIKRKGLTLPLIVTGTAITPVGRVKISITKNVKI